MKHSYEKASGLLDSFSSSQDASLMLVSCSLLQPCASNCQSSLSLFLLCLVSSEPTYTFLVHTNLFHSLLKLKRLVKGPELSNILKNRLLFFSSKLKRSLPSSRTAPFTDTHTMWVSVPGTLLSVPCLWPSYPAWRSTINQLLQTAQLPFPFPNRVWRNQR